MRRFVLRQHRIQFFVIELLYSQTALNCLRNDKIQTVLERGYQFVVIMLRHLRHSKLISSTEDSFDHQISHILYTTDSQCPLPFVCTNYGRGFITLNQSLTHSLSITYCRKWSDLMKKKGSGIASFSHSISLWFWNMTARAVHG